MADPSIELTEAQVAAQEFVVAIETLSERAEAMLDAGLNRRALVLLLQDQTGGLSKRAIDSVLDALPRLAEAYLR
jgi:hypothetical protein